jgi:hypothetical protein
MVIKRFRFLDSTVIASLLLTAVGCSHSELVGRWQGALPGGPVSTSGALEFRSDGTYEQTIDFMGQQVARVGTYKADGQILLLRTLDLKANGVSVGNRLPGPMARMMTQDISINYRQDGDRLTLQLGNATGTLERVK